MRSGFKTLTPADKMICFSQLKPPIILVSFFYAHFHVTHSSPSTLSIFSASIVPEINLGLKCLSSKFPLKRFPVVSDSLAKLQASHSGSGRKSKLLPMETQDSLYIKSCDTFNSPSSNDSSNTQGNNSTLLLMFLNRIRLVN